MRWRRSAISDQVSAISDQRSGASDQRLAIRAVTLFVACLTACGGSVAAPPLPQRFGPANPGQVRDWVVATRPTHSAKLKFSWSYIDPEERHKGKGSASIASPDSLRFDVAGPLNMGRSAAMVIGDAAIWTDGSDQISKIAPNYPLLWAMLGIARLPARGDDVAASEDERSQSWRYVNGADTVIYVRTIGSPATLMTVVQSAGKQVGRVVTQFDAAGKPARSTLMVPSHRSRVDITFTSDTSYASLPKDTWIAPRDQ